MKTNNIMEKSITFEGSHKIKQQFYFQVSNRWVQDKFKRKIERIPSYNNIGNLEVNEVLGLFPYLSNQPFLLVERILVRKNQVKNSFRVKLSLNFVHFFLQPNSELDERESEDYIRLANIQKKEDPPELILALRRIIGLKKGSEHFIPQFLVEEEMEILSNEDTSQVTVTFKKVLLIKDFRP